MIDPQKGEQIAGSMLQSFVEEECINIFLMVFLIPSGVLVRYVIHGILSVWALLHIANLANEQLINNPETVGLVSMKPLIDQITFMKVEIV